MSSLIMVVGFVLACDGAYLLYRAEFDYAIDSNFATPMVIMFFVLTFINNHLLPGLQSSEGTIIDHDPGWFIICFISACETAIICGTYAGIKLIAKKTRERK